MPNTPINTFRIKHTYEDLLESTNLINAKSAELLESLDQVLTQLQGTGTGSTPISIKGRIPKQPFSGSTTVTHTFTQSMYGFGIANDGGSDLSFTIGADTFTVKSGEVWEYPMESFTQVTITTTVAYRAWGLI